MEKAVLIAVFAAALVYLVTRLVRSVRRTRKNNCGPDCNCE